MELKTRPDWHYDQHRYPSVFWRRISTYSLEGREDRQWQGRNLDGASQQVGDDKHEHAKLPSPSAMGRPSIKVGIFLVLEYMRLALQGETQALHTGRDQAHEDSNLDGQKSIQCPKAQQEQQ